MATLTFDPGTAGALELFTDSTGAVTVAAMAFPAPPLETVTAGNIDTEGDLIAARRHQNRQITLTLNVRGSTAAAARAAVAAVEAKIAAVARGDGELRWVNDDGDPFTFDLLAADGYDLGYDITYFVGHAASITVTLTAKPYARGDEVALSVHSETTLPVLIFTETGIDGDVPALGRLVVSEDSGNLQNTVAWGLQSRYYDSNAAAKLFVQAETIQLTGTASVAGASGTAAANTSVTTSYVPMTLLTGRHIGDFRVLARIKVPASNAGIMSARLAWRAGDRNFTRNAPIQIDPGERGDDWYVYDLGTMFVPPQRYGSPASATEVEVKSTNTGNWDDVFVDWLLFVPIGEGSGEANANLSFDAPTPPLAANGEFHLLSDGTATNDPVAGWGSPDIYEGDYLRVPVGGTTRFVVKAARNYAAGDSGIDDISAQLFVTPRYLSIR